MSVDGLLNEETDVHTDSDSCKECVGGNPMALWSELLMLESRNYGECRQFSLQIGGLTPALT